MLVFFAAKGYHSVDSWGTADPRALRQTFIDFRADLQSTLSNSTAQLYLVGARLFARWLAFEGVCSNFTDNVKGVAVSVGHKRDALTVDQSRTLLASFDTSTLKGKRDLAITALMLSTGLRCVEVTRADIGDIENRQGIWFLRVHGKKRDGKDEVVRLDPRVKAIIDAYLSARELPTGDNLFDGADMQPLFASVSNRNRGDRLTTCSISRMVKAALKRIGLDSQRLVAHSLRHSFVTQALLAGVAEKDVIQVARHRSSNVIAVYRHDIDRMKNVAENVVADGLFSAA